MHRLIQGVTDSETQVDHRNHDGLDNQRANLRTTSRAGNQQNRLGAASNSTTGVRGVTYHQEKHKYMVQVGYGGRNHYVGYFSTLEEAAEASEAARQKHHTERQ
jgi:hypothetical protein